MKTYKAKSFEITWEPDKCIHSTNCWKQLSSVFNPTKRPWINVDGAEDEKIQAQIDKCPSGAVSYKAQNINKEENPISAAKFPVLTELEKDKNYAWCSCGKSTKQPYCDGSHQGTSMRPIVFKPKENKKHALCMCKQTKNPPFCDGTHTTID